MVIESIFLTRFWVLAREASHLPQRLWLDKFHKIVVPSL
jgi:hypothetical protein